jgi:hypothetical protein
VPPGPVEVVLLLETMLAFADKPRLLRSVASALPVGGRFAFTVEEGRPLTASERRLMPASDTVRLVPLPALLAALDRAGLEVRWRQEVTPTHLAAVDGLLEAFAREEAALTAGLGRGTLAELVAGHRLWGRWLREGRVRKLAMVVERAGR